MAAMAAMACRPALTELLQLEAVAVLAVVQPQAAQAALVAVVIQEVPAATQLPTREAVAVGLSVLAQGKYMATAAPVSSSSATQHKEITLAHFCQINQDNIVTQVIVVSDDDCAGGNFPDSEHAGAYFCNRLLGGTWKQTSYNNNFRKRYAGIGFKYDSALDMFITPQPFPSWTLDAQGDWQAPTPKPEGPHTWDEAAQEWVEVVTA